MTQHYSNPARANDPHALPDIETFEASLAYCPQCDESAVSDWDGDYNCKEHGKFHPDAETVESGWFYWFCFPGCLPDSDPMGPFAMEAEALADARYDVEAEDDYDAMTAHDPIETDDNALANARDAEDFATGDDVAQLDEQDGDE